METRWPPAMLRYSYTILSRNSFDSVKFLAQGGLGVVFTAKLKAKFHLPGITGDTDEKKRRTTTTQVVLKCVLNPNDWNSEISGYHHNRENPHVVGVAALVLMSSRECNQLCKDRKNYVTRPEGSLVPAMVFEKWDGSLDDAIEDGLVANWGLLAAVDVMIGVAKAMAELHKNFSMHRDINPANILYKTNATGDLVGALSDLGLCTTLTRETRIKTAKTRKTLNCGTDGFMAPELSTGMYSHPADVFSMSVTVQQTIRATGLKVKEFDSKIASLLRKGKNQNPASRPTAEEFLTALEDYKNDLVEEETEREDTRRRSGLRARRKEKRKDDFAYTMRLRRR